MEFRIFSQVWNVLDKHNLACVVCAVGCVHVLHQDKLDGVCCDCLSVPVILIFLHENVGAWNPLFNLHGTIAHISSRINGPGLAVGLHSRLVDRA